MIIFIQEFLYTCRKFRNNLFTTFIIILLLSLGIGVNVALFSILDPLFVRKLPVNNPEELVWIGSKGSHGQIHVSDFSFFREYQDNTQMFTEVFSFAPIATCNTIYSVCLQSKNFLEQST